MNKVLALSGPSNRGKTTTLKLVADLLKAAYPGALLHERLYKVDCTYIFDIDGRKVGIETQGDPGSRLARSLQRFVDESCEVIVCACRSSGATMGLVKQCASHGYDLRWFEKARSTDGAAQQADNERMAQEIFDAVVVALKD